jgi:hypothetical protein
MIELLLAILFSSMIVLVAMMTFRTAAKTMGRIDELAAENKMIRAGYYLALQDADYWHSHADPTYPYMSHFNSATMLYAPTTFKNDADLGGGLQAASAGWDATTTDSGTQVLPGVDSPEPLANSVWDARPFRRTVWRNDFYDASDRPTFANPNLVDAASPQAWYRNHVQQGLESGVYMRHAMDPNYRYIMNWDFRPEGLAAGSNGFGNTSPSNDFFSSLVLWTNTTQTSWTSYGSKWIYGNQNCRVANERAWDPWHIVGDYAQVSNCEGKRRLAGAIVEDFGAQGSMPDDLYELARIADYRSGLFWYAQAMLGVYGLMDYTRRGEPVLIQASSINLTQDAYVGTEDDRLDRDFSKGEIPWSLNGGGGSLIYYRQMGVLASGGSRGSGVDQFAYPVSFRDEYPLFNRLNYWARIPSEFDLRREQALIGARFAFFNDFDNFAGMGKTGLMSVGGDGNVDTYLPNGYGGPPLRAPMAMFYPRLAARRRISTETYDWSLPNWDAIKPFELLYYNGESDNTLDRGQYAAITRPDDYRYVRANHWQVMQSRHTCSTWHLPQSYTNDQLPDLQGEGLEGMAMGTAIYRYRYNGNEVARCAIMLHKDGSKLRTINFNVFSTSLRGARQYWGRRTGTAGMDDGFGNQVKIGDFYQ